MALLTDLHSRNRFHDGRLSVSYVTDRTYGITPLASDKVPMLIVAWYCMISGLVGDRFSKPTSLVCSAMVCGVPYAVEPIIAQEPRNLRFPSLVGSCD